MINYGSFLWDGDAGFVASRSYNMAIGTLSALAGYNPKPEENPLACAVSIMLDIDDYGNWSDLTIGEYIGLIAQCKEGSYNCGQYCSEHTKDVPYMYALHAIAIALPEAAKASPLIRLFCNIHYEQYYECITSGKCESSISGFDHSPKLLVIVSGYADFVRSGYLFWKDTDNYYKSMSSVLISNVYKFLVDPVVRSEDKLMKIYMKPGTAIGVVLSEKGDDEYGKE